MGSQFTPSRTRPALFAAEFEPADSLGRRRAIRAPVSLDGRLGRGGLDRTLCRVIDLSAHGARIQTYSELRTGAALWLTLPDATQCAARVMWVDDFEAGIEFNVPLSEDILKPLTA